MSLFTPLRGLLLACVTLAGQAMAAEPLSWTSTTPATTRFSRSAR
jgi:hypothetical protein